MAQLYRLQSSVHQAQQPSRSAGVQRTSDRNKIEITARGIHRESPRSIFIQLFSHTNPPRHAVIICI
jgi:hypothetical protein